MLRVSVDIGGTFTDCFVVWDRKYIEAKALTTHHNLAMGFNEALGKACKVLGIDLEDILSEVDSVRYATTLGTNALIEHKGPKIGMLVTAGFEATVPLSRARGYGEGLDNLGQQDMPNAERPDPLVKAHMIRGVRERVDFTGKLVMALDEEDVRKQIRDLVDQGAEIIVVALVNSVVNPSHEQRIQEILLDEYPSHLLGAIPIILSHQVAGRKGEYVRATSAIVDGYLHSTMYHALSALEQNLRTHRYHKPMLVIHNSGGMAQLNSTDALQTIHSGPVSGIGASEHLAMQAALGNVWPPIWAAPATTSASSSKAASSTMISIRSSTAGWSPCRWSISSRSARAAAPSPPMTGCTRRSNAVRKARAPTPAPPATTVADAAPPSPTPI